MGCRSRRPTVIEQAGGYAGGASNEHHPAFCPALAHAWPRAGPCASSKFCSFILFLSQQVAHSPVRPTPDPLSDQEAIFLPLPKAHTRLLHAPLPFFVTGTRTRTSYTPGHYEHDPPTPCHATTSSCPAGSVLGLGHGSQPTRMRALLCQHGSTTQGHHFYHPREHS